MPTIIQIAWNYSKIIQRDRKKEKRRIKCDNCSLRARREKVFFTKDTVTIFAMTSYTLRALEQHRAFSARAYGLYHGNFGVFRSPRELRIIHSRGCGPKCTGRVRRRRRRRHRGLESHLKTWPEEQRLEFRHSGSPSLLNLLTGTKIFSFYSALITFSSRIAFMERRSLTDV